MKKKDRKKNKSKNLWLHDPEEKDFPAAQDYLELHFAFDVALEIVDRLRREGTMMKKAKDILRASGLPLLPKNNIHVKKNIEKVKTGKCKLSPVLLVRGNKLLIADGYHRVCAIYYLSEDLTIPCRITGRR